MPELSWFAGVGGEKGANPDTGEETLGVEVLRKVASDSRISFVRAPAAIGVGNVAGTTARGARCWLELPQQQGRRRQIASLGRR